MRAGSIGGPACVTPPFAWCSEISEAGTTSITNGRAAASRATASASVCSAAFMRGDAKSARAPCNRTGGHNRVGPVVRECVAGPHLRSAGGPLRPCVRARLLWRGLSCPARRRACPRDDLARDRDARQPRAPRRRGRGRRDRRRRRHPDPDPRRVPARGGRLRAAARGRVRGGGLHAAAQRGRGDGDRAARARRWTAGPGLARRARGHVGAGAGRAELDAGHQAALRRLQRARSGRVRAPAVRHPPAGRARAGRRGGLPELLVAHDGAEGDAGRAAAPALLQGPMRPAVRQRAWRSSTRASRPTPSRAGRSRTRSASSRTTARSTRCAATSTGCARGSTRWASSPRCVR